MSHKYTARELRCEGQGSKGEFRVLASDPGWAFLMQEECIQVPVRGSSPQSKIDVTVQKILVPSPVFGETVKGGRKCLETG